MEYLFLGFAIALVIGFEFVNGFHDTANAVATVIYTNSLKPTYAVVWSGICNLLGVITSSGVVAFSIVALLPVELLVSKESSQSLIMVLALLTSAIIWNLGTWYLGLPISSTHSLIGSILGIGLANSVLSTENNWWDGVNWIKMQEVLISLLISPLIGFCGAAILFIIAKFLIKQENLYTAPTEEAPSLGIRAMLILTCTGVSFAHGSNDGQKGMGLMMLVLVILLPSIFSLNMHTSPQAIAQLVATSQAAIPVLESQIRGNSIHNQLFANSQSELTNFLKPQGQLDENIWRSLASESQLIGKILSISSDFMDIAESDRNQIRTDIYLVANTITKLENQQKLANLDQQSLLIDYRNQLDKTTKFIPFWVKITIALALGSGTMIGWKRVVITVGEKIGKEPLNYAQGAIAELITMTTIVTADYFGLPVSTTHILSSGIAGSMVANRSGVQSDTLKNLLLAWLLTLPVCILLGFGTYTISLFAVHQFSNTLA
ncbi:low-affinity inorganic phosphate transporter [Pseudanabaena sp. lw0831]|uniref:inorganic phosphate transporter n=1 Tax=Pseudanabaena sp. lw0831 TaxID=1357935 RepID=UPI00191632BE|nr:inorganic phosphate transporter [Pseudanabaena sp. lw0831]GBO56521.1 low-affinity inorganic phosphate transporter [Pseudanabaena sp. lw0831]